MIKPNYDLLNSILSTSDVQFTTTWMDAVRVVYAKTFSILEGNRLETVGQMEKLASKYNSLEEKYQACAAELDHLKAHIRSLSKED